MTSRNDFFHSPPKQKTLTLAAIPPNPPLDKPKAMDNINSAMLLLDFEKGFAQTFSSFRIASMDPKLVHYNYCKGLTTTPLPPDTRVLVTGANGYVAQRLIPELVDRGYHVRCMVKNKYYSFALKHPRI